jgi:L-ascorbate metabolism protein UlaG (beta-lactamase superfamily)
MLRFIKRALLVLLALIALLALAAAWAWHQHASLAPYEPLRFPAAAQSPRTPDSSLRVTWAGVATLMFDDGETAIMTDGFFSHPGLLSLRRIEPDRAVIAQSLQRLGVKKLAVVMPIHSHYDHAMDSPVVAQTTGALLVGGESTVNIGLGNNLPIERIRRVLPGDTLTFGRFRVTWLRSQHSPNAFFTGEIERPFTPPSKASAYRMGDCYSLLIEHDGRSILVQGSAGFEPGALAGRHAEVVYLGIAPLGKQPPQFQADFWREVVQAVGARRVVPIHWDDFFLPLSEPLQPMNPLMDKFEAGMHFVQSQSQAQKIDLRLPTEWQAIDPFWNLPR